MECKWSGKFCKLYKNTYQYLVFSHRIHLKFQAHHILQQKLIKYFVWMNSDNSFINKFHSSMFYSFNFSSLYEDYIKDTTCF